MGNERENMQLEIGGRQTGRTTRMIHWLRLNEHAILLVHSEHEAQRLRNMYDHDGIMELANRIVTADSHLKRRPSFHSPVIGIDNADLILKQIFGNVQKVTMESS